MKKVLTVFFGLLLVFATLAYAATPPRVKEDLQRVFSVLNMEHMLLSKLAKSRWPVPLRGVQDRVKKIQLYREYQRLTDGVFSMIWGDFVTRGVVFSGNYLLAGMGSRIGVFDVSNPAEIKLVNKLPLYGTAYAVAYDRRLHTLYVASGHAGLSILDISSPVHTKRIGWFLLPHSAYARWLALGEPYVYIASERGCMIVDVSNKRKPKFVRQILYEPVKYVWVDGHILYLTLKGQRVYVFDIRQKDKPKFLTKFNLSYPLAHLEVDPAPGYLITVGKYAYMANGHQGVAVLDVGNPSKPRLIRRVYLDGRYASFITVYKNIISVPTQERIFLLDISAPSKPVVVKKVKGYGGYLTAGFSQKELGVFLTSRSSFHLVNMENILEPKVLGTYKDPPSARGISVYKNNLFLANGSGGLYIYDLLNPASPKLVRKVDALGYANGVSVLSPFVYVTEGLAGVSVVDARSPSMAQVRRYIEFENVAWNVAQSNGYAYVASGEQGVSIFSVAHPEKPKYLEKTAVRLKKYPGYVYVLNVMVKGSELYQVGPSCGPYVYNIENPQKPVLVRSFALGGMDIAVKGKTVYVAGYTNGVYVLDMNEGMENNRLSFKTGGKAVGLELKGNRLYVADFDKGLLIFDVTNSKELKLVRKYKTRGNARDVVVSGSYAYVADWKAGLTVIDLEKEAVL